MASDSPESLMTLCTDFCLRNLEGTLCYLLDNETLRLHPDIFLPSEICDKLVNEYVWAYGGAVVWFGQELGTQGRGNLSFLKKGRIHRAVFWFFFFFFSDEPHIGNKDLH